MHLFCESVKSRAAALIPALPMICRRDPMPTHRVNTRDDRRPFTCTDGCASVGTGSSGHGSTILTTGSGQVGSRVSVTDPVSDPVL